MVASRFFVAALATAALAACTSTTEPVRDCCYRGPVAVTRLQNLEVVTEDGRRLSFAEALPGFAPQQGIFTSSLPFTHVQEGDVIRASLIPLFPIYDANRNGHLEKPEIIVLYAREAARATGVPIAHLSAGGPVWAVSAPNADVGGLVRWQKSRRAQMSPEGRGMFEDLERLGIDLRTRGSENGGRDTGIFFIN